MHIFRIGMIHKVFMSKYVRSLKSSPALYWTAEICCRTALFARQTIAKPGLYLQPEIRWANEIFVGFWWRHGFGPSAREETLSALQFVIANNESPLDGVLESPELPTSISLDLNTAFLVASMFPLGCPKRMMACGDRSEFNGTHTHTHIFGSSSEWHNEMHRQRIRHLRQQTALVASIQHRLFICV